MRTLFFNIRSGLILILFIGASAMLSAEVLTLDKDACLEAALENNAELLNAAIELNISERADKSSWNQFLPGITASLGLSQSSSPVSSISSDGVSLSPGITFSYTLKPGLRESIEQISLDLESKKISYEDVRLQLLMNVEVEFYYLITSKGNLDIEKKNIELAEKQYEKTQAKFSSGLATELEVLQARVNVANLMPTYSSLESAYRNRFKEFLVVLGIDPQKEVELEGELVVDSIDLNADDLIDKYLENRADLKTLNNNIAVLESSLRMTEKNTRLPAATVSATLGSTVRDPFSSAAWSGYSFDDNSTLSLSLGVSIGLDNYIPGSSGDLTIKDMEDSIEQARINLKTLNESAGLEIRNLVDSLVTDRENLELSELNLELSETSYKMTEESFSRGKSDRMTLDDAQQNLLTARQNLLESRYQYVSDLITLRAALGLESFEELR